MYSSWKIAHFSPSFSRDPGIFIFCKRPRSSSSKPLQRAHGTEPHRLIFMCKSLFICDLRYCNWLISEALEPVLTFLKARACDSA
jgi:hypothetical protein